MRRVPEVCVQGMADLWSHASQQALALGAQGTGGLPAGRVRPVAGMHCGEPERAA